MKNLFFRFTKKQTLNFNKQTSFVSRSIKKQKLHFNNRTNFLINIKTIIVFQDFFIQLKKFNLMFSLIFFFYNYDDYDDSHNLYFFYFITDYDVFDQHNFNFTVFDSFNFNIANFNLFNFNIADFNLFNFSIANSKSVTILIRFKKLLLSNLLLSLI